MPAYRIPRRSGPHRIAALALYRALLAQCRRLPSHEIQRDELQNLVRNRFKQARHEQSTRRLKVSFQAGYEAIDYLDAAVAGSEESKSYILTLLESAPAKVKQAITLPSHPGSTRDKPENFSSSTEEAPTKARRSIFDRPLPLSELSGKRRVPVLVNANHIPMLRIKKPQPQHLSGFLSNRVRQRQKRHDRKDRLVEDLSLAEWEDEWDDLLDASQTTQRSPGSVTQHHEEPAWSDAVEDEIGTVQRQLAEERRKNRLMAEKMQAIVDRETALAEQEKADRKAQSALARRIEMDARDSAKIQEP